MEFCPEDSPVLSIGPDDSSVTKCDSDKISQVTIRSEEGDDRDRQGTVKIDDLVELDVTVAGLEGVRRSWTHVDQEAFIPSGTKFTVYIFYTNGRTYRAVYAQPPGYPDNLQVFETIVTQTLRFSE